MVQRVDPASLAPELAEPTQARLSAILVAFQAAQGAPPGQTRTHAQAERLAIELVARIRAGEDMAALARTHDDDLGGRVRSGDLGWIRRRSPQIPALFDPVFGLPSGQVQDPIASDWGWIILRRER